MRRLPAQLLFCFSTGRRAIDHNEATHPSTMTSRFIGRSRHHRQIQVSTNDFGNLANWYAFVGHTVVTSAGNALLQRQPVQMSGIEPVHSRPAVATVAY